MEGYLLDGALDHWMHDEMGLGDFNVLLEVEQ
jgi:hypothetical protein